MSTIQQTQSAIAQQQQQQQEQIQLIKQMYAKDATDLELEHFLYVCKKTGLNPLTRQIYFVKRKGQVTIQTGIDGFRSIAESTGEYMPADEEPVYQYDEKGNLISCTLFVKRYHQITQTWHKVVAKAYFNEYVQYVNDYNKQGVIAGKKISDMWERMKHTMLSKCTEALALRKAFPQQLSGLYTSDEMMQADIQTLQAVQEIKHETQGIKQEVKQSETKQEVKEQVQEQIEAKLAEKPIKRISLKQQKMMFAVARSKELDVQELKAYLQHFGYINDSTKEIKDEDFGEIISAIENDKVMVWLEHSMADVSGAIIDFPIE